MSRYEQFGVEFEVITDRKMTTSRLEDRIIIQKIAYLLFRTIGNNFEYTEFSWYLHGVFSWDLWHDIISFGSPASANLSTTRLTELEYIKKEFRNSGLSRYFNDAEDLELITTILYCSEKKADLHKDNEYLITKVKALKGKFNHEQIKSTINEIKTVDWRFIPLTNNTMWEY